MVAWITASIGLSLFSFDAIPTRIWFGGIGWIWTIIFSICWITMVRAVWALTLICICLVGTRWWICDCVIKKVTSGWIVSLCSIIQAHWVVLIIYVCLNIPILSGNSCVRSICRIWFHLCRICLVCSIVCSRKRCVISGCKYLLTRLIDFSSLVVNGCISHRYISWIVGHWVILVVNIVLYVPRNITII